MELEAVWRSALLEKLEFCSREFRTIWITWWEFEGGRIFGEDAVSSLNAGWMLAPYAKEQSASSFWRTRSRYPNHLEVYEVYEQRRQRTSAF